MAHLNQRKFFERVKGKFPKNFSNVKVIDFGSLDVNGSLKDLFFDSHYIGVDIHDGKNVDVISEAHKFQSLVKVDTVISGEMLEHDEFWLESLKNMYAQLKPGGLIAVSCAGLNRVEHGTKRTTGENNLWGTAPDYYRNLVREDFELFAREVGLNYCEFSTDEGNYDSYFWGVKPMEGTISIVIPTCKKEHLEPCLESIRKYTDREVEIITVLNGYNGEIPKDTKSLIFPERIGYTNAISEGINIATGDYIILMNDDTQILESPKNVWLDMLMIPFIDPQIGITGPLRSFCHQIQRDFMIFFLVCIKNELLKQFPLDKIFNPGYGEDIDFCVRIQNAGYKMAQVPVEEKMMGNGKWICQYPILHEAEKTVFDNPKWEEITHRNMKVLEERYGLPQGWFYPDDINEYRRLISEVPDNGSICELGCYKGRSLCSVADIIKKKNLKITVVDIFTGTDSEVKEPDYKEEFLNNTKRFGLYPNAITGYTTEIAKQIPDESFDLLFIDADHSYEAVKRDIKDWKSKVKKTGQICGHDYGNHEEVTRAVNESIEIVHSSGSVWSETKKHHISVSLCTRNRYKTTLPLAMASLITQTRKPDFVYIYDDSTPDNWVDMRELPEIKYILATYDRLKIGWYIIYGQKKGQHYGDQTVNSMAKDLVWRFDDDEVAEPDCLEKLEKAMTRDTGAVACKIEIPTNPMEGVATGRLDRIRIEPNMQWVGGKGEVEHLHSSFLYRARVANFDLRLSPRSFRGETMFSHEIFMKGYKLKVINDTTIWHFHENKGGCRTPIEEKTSMELYAHDEAIFNAWKNVKDKKIFFLDSGKGDHVVFRKLLDDLNIKDIPIACCYTDVFDGFQTMSLSAAIQLGYNPDQYNLYAWMDRNNWKGTLYDAFRKLYDL